VHSDQPNLPEEVRLFKQTPMDQEESKAPATSTFERLAGSEEKPYHRRKRTMPAIRTDLKYDSP
jgi:hypothetical protein